MEQIRDALQRALDESAENLQQVVSVEVEWDGKGSRLAVDMQLEADDPQELDVVADRVLDAAMKRMSSTPVEDSDDLVVRESSLTPA